MNLPTAMADYMNSTGMGHDALRTGGELPLVFDEDLRVRLVPMPDGGITLESRVCPMPPSTEDRERLVAKALQLGFARMEGHAEGLAMAEDREALRLQSFLSADATRIDLEARLESHINALAWWRSALS